jgi:hypothetical protein
MSESAVYVDRGVNRQARHATWEHARNSLGIARLLVHEKRCESLIDTACRMAVECACRAALDATGRPFEGNMPLAAAHLGMPEDFWRELDRAAIGRARLDATERFMAWTAGYLRHEAPHMTWVY